MSFWGLTGTGSSPKSSFRARVQPSPLPSYPPCASSVEPDSAPIRQAAIRPSALGRMLADQGITLVYGGGGVGLMGLVANAALDSGGKVIGIIPRFLLEREAGHPALTETAVVETMHERKLQMFERFRRLRGAARRASAPSRSCSRSCPGAPSACTASRS